MIKHYSAVFIGIVAGFSLGAPVNALMNETVIDSCLSKTQSHKLVSFRGFYGESFGCIDRRYL